MNDAYLHSIGLQSGWVAPCQNSAERTEKMELGESDAKKMSKIHFFREIDFTKF